LSSRHAEKIPGGGYYVITQYRAGKDSDGLPLDGDLREYLKATYLRPFATVILSVPPSCQASAAFILR
jgi:hypothetical protein